MSEAAAGNLAGIVMVLFGKILKDTQDIGILLSITGQPLQAATVGMRMRKKIRTIGQKRYCGIEVITSITTVTVSLIPSRLK